MGVTARRWFVAMAITIPLAVGGAAHAQETRGEYLGSYRCAQGTTRLRLTFFDDGRSGRFAFAAGAISGSYIFAVQPTDGGDMRLVPQRWERQPPGYMMVAARVHLDGDTIAGEIENPSCGSLSARRSGPASGSQIAEQAQPAPSDQRLRYARPVPRLSDRSSYQSVRGREYDVESAPSNAVADRSIYLPGHKDALEAYLTKRASGTKAMLDDCLYRMEHRYPPTGFQVLPYAEQIRRSQETDAMLAECNRQSKGDFGTVMSDFRAAITEWAASQPASYDGLRTLREAESEYNSIGFHSYRESLTFAAAQRIRPVVAEVFTSRRAAIEQQIRPQLMADVFKSNDTQIVADLFHDDHQMVATYRNALTQRQAGAARAAAERAVPAGLNGELAVAATQAFARAPRIVLGQSMGATTVAGTSINVNAMVMTQQYDFAARNAKCVAAAGGKRSCNYELNFGAGGSVIGLQIPRQQSGWFRRHDIFYMDGGRMRSATLDRDLIAVASAAGSQNVSHDDAKCEIVGGAALDWEGGGGMPSGVRWDPSIRRPC